MPRHRPAQHHQQHRVKALASRTAPSSPIDGTNTHRDGVGRHREQRRQQTVAFANLPEQGQHAQPAQPLPATCDTMRERKHQPDQDAERHADTSDSFTTSCSTASAVMALAQKLTMCFTPLIANGQITYEFGTTRRPDDPERPGD
uniref:Uncharacterized protein n=1 Tax=Anopheles coluzzii TaxID=1518534 RepID=A0A8W7NZ35_ANOCL